MGFDAKFAADMIMGGVKALTETGTDAFEKISDTKIKEKDHDTDNQIKVLKQKTSGISDIIHTATDSLNTVSNVADKIFHSINLTRKTSAEIAQMEKHTEAEIKSINNELKKIENEHIQKLQELDNKRADEQEKNKMYYDIKMKCLDIVEKGVDAQIMIIKNMLQGNCDYQALLSAIEELNKIPSALKQQLMIDKE